MQRDCKFSTSKAKVIFSWICDFHVGSQSTFAYKIPSSEKPQRHQPFSHAGDTTIYDLHICYQLVKLIKRDLFVRHFYAISRVTNCLLYTSDAADE